MQVNSYLELREARSRQIFENNLGGLSPLRVALIVEGEKRFLPSSKKYLERPERNFKEMSQTIMNAQHKALKFAPSLFSFLLLCAALIASSALVNAQAKRAETVAADEQANVIEPTKSFDLTGTWVVTITPDDGTPSFIGYYSFGADGNASFSSAGPPIPALGNPGYGVWKRVRNNRFAVTIRMNSYSETFQFDGTLKINGKFRMPTANTFVAQNTVIVYDAAGNEIVTLAGSAQGQRMVVED